MEPYHCKSCGTEDPTHFDDERASMCVGCQEEDDDQVRELQAEEEGVLLARVVELHGPHHIGKSTILDQMRLD